MKKVTRKLKQTLSILLVAAMVITMVPQNTMTVSATELETVEETSTETIGETVETEETVEAAQEEETASEEASEEISEETGDDETEGGEDVEEDVIEDPATEETDTEEVPEGTEEENKKSLLDVEVMTTGDSHTVTVIEGTDTAADSYTFGDGDANKSATEGTDYKFTVAAATGYEVKSVEAYTDYNSADDKGTPVTVSEDSGVANGYIIAGAALTDDITIVVTTAELEYTITFAGDNAASVYAVKDNIIDDGTNLMTAATAPKVKHGENIKFQVNAAEGYEVSTVTPEDGEALKADDDGYYTYANVTADKTITIATEAKTQEYTLTLNPDEDEKHQTLTVETEANASETDKKVAFAQNADHMKVSAIKVDDKDAEKAEGKRNTYNVPTGSKKLTFTVTASGNYQPVVKLIQGEREEELAADNDKTPYNYTVMVSTITDKTAVISVTEERENRRITVEHDATVEVTAVVAGKAVASVALDKETDLTKGTAFNVNDGDVVKITVTAKKHYKIASAKTTVGAGSEKTEKTAADKFTYTVTATADATTVVTTEALVETVISAGGEALPRTKNGYDVQVGTQYTAVLNAGGEAADLTAATVDVENAATAAIADDNKSVTITPNEAAAGKTLKLTLKANSEDNESEIKCDVTLKVAALATKVKVAGVKNGKISQNADTTKEYKITITPKTASKTLAAEVIESTDDADTVDAEVKGDVLRITNKTVTASDKPIATVKLYNTAVSEDEKKYVTGGEIKVYSKAPALVNIKPTVALKDATDTTLTLTLGSKKVEPVNTGKVFYKVVITSDAKNKAGDLRPNTIKETDTKYIERTGDSQDELFTVVSDTNPGEGRAWNFKVAVSLIQTKDGTAPSTDNENKAFATADNKVAKTSKPFATKAPAYATKISLKKKTTKIYSGQSNVEVAQVIFDKNATYKVFEVTNKEALAEKGLTVSEDTVNNKIIVSAAKASKGAVIGKHTINVKATDADGDMKVATASITVEVVQGIERLKISNAPKTVYKADGKAASFKVGVDYYGYEKAPKTKKVEWFIVSDNAKLKDYVTVKNGKVSIAKNYVVASDPEDNKFQVKVIARDFKRNDAGNDVVGLSDHIEITAQAAQLGEVVIVGSDGHVVARSGDTVTADKLAYTSAVVLRKGVPEKEEYTDADYTVAKVTFTSSNKKALGISSENGYIWINKPGKDIKITATATDGSKAKAELKKLTVQYAETGELGLQIEQFKYVGWNSFRIGSEWDYKENKENKVDSIEYYGAKDTRFRIDVAQLLSETDNKWSTDIAGVADCKLQVKGAKILDQEDDRYTIAAQKNPVTITLTQNSGDCKHKTKTYVLKNMALNTKKSLSAKAKNTLFAGQYNREQRVIYTLKSNGYDFTNKYAMVAVDAFDYYKNDDRYYTFLKNAPTVGGYTPVNADGTIDLYFTQLNEHTTNIPAGNYKLNISVGTVNEDGVFIADTKAAGVTLKATAQKAVKTKLNAKYTMSVKAGAKAQLTLSNKKTQLKEAALLNANIKGQQNEFAKYFAITGNEQDGFTLKLQDGLTQEQLGYITSSKGKNDLTGWVRYTYSDGINTIEDVETQVTVSFKDAKYSLSKTTILEGAETATVKLYSGKNEAGASEHVFAVSAGGDFSYKESNGSEIILGINDPEKLPNKNSVTLYVVPEGSCYVSALDALKTATESGSDDDKVNAIIAYRGAVQRYGVKLTTTISVVEKAKADNKIKIDKKNLKKTFMPIDYQGGKYFVYVPYTKTAEVDIQTITVQGEDNQALFTMKALSDENKIAVELDKAALDAAEEAKKVAYGQKDVTVKADVYFGEGIKTETITLTLTLPQKAKSYDEVCTAAEEALKKLNDTKLPFDKWSTQPEVEKANVVRNAYYMIRSALGSLPEQMDSGAEWNIIPLDADDIPADCYEYQAPTPKEDGSLVFKVTLHDGALKGKDGYEDSKKEITVNFVMDATGIRPEDLTEEFNAAVGKLSTDFTATNDTTEADILAFVRQELNLSEQPTLRVGMKQNSFYKEPATRNLSGLISGRLVLYDIKNGGDEITADFKLTIAQLLGLEGTAAAIQAAWSNNMEVSNKTTKADAAKVIDEAIVNPDIDWDWDKIEKDGGAIAGV